MFNRIGILFNHLSRSTLNYRKMSSQKVRIGVCQLTSRDNKQENFQIGQKLIEQAKKEEAKVS